MTKRRYAAHQILTPAGAWSMAVVEVQDGTVSEVYHFDGELPFTEWLGGTITVLPDADGTLRAYKDNKPLE